MKSLIKKFLAVIFIKPEPKILSDIKAVIAYGPKYVNTGYHSRVISSGRPLGGK